MDDVTENVSHNLSQLDINERPIKKNRADSFRHFKHDFLYFTKHHL